MNIAIDPHSVPSRSLKEAVIEEPSAGAQDLLRDDGGPSRIWFQLAGAFLYGAAIVIALNANFEPEPMTLEAGIEMVNDSSPSEDQSPPQQQEQTPPPEASEPPPPPPPPPPPEAETPPPPPPPPAPESPPAPAPEAAEPVEPPPPPPPPAPETPPPPKIEPPKPAPPKVAPKVEQKPAAPKKSSQASSGGKKTVGAVPSAYAQMVYQRINRVASGAYPREAISKNIQGRVGYTIVIGTAGQLISKSVSSSGNPVLDRAASEALSRSAPFPAPPNLGAHSYRISGAIVYRMR